MQLAPPGATLARSEAQLRAEEYEATVEIAALQVRANSARNSAIRPQFCAQFCAQFSDRHVIAALQSKLSVARTSTFETALGAKLAWHAAVGAEKAPKALNAVSHAERPAPYLGGGDDQKSCVRADAARATRP